MTQKHYDAAPEGSGSQPKKILPESIEQSAEELFPIENKDLGFGKVEDWRGPTRSLALILATEAAEKVRGEYEERIRQLEQKSKDLIQAVRMKFPIVDISNGKDMDLHHALHSLEQQLQSQIKQ